LRSEGEWGKFRKLWEVGQNCMAPAGKKTVAGERETAGKEAHQLPNGIARKEDGSQVARLVRWKVRSCLTDFVPLRGGRNSGVRGALGPTKKH